MDEANPMVAEMADRLFADLAADRRAPFETVWRAINQAGLATLLVMEDHGGLGGGWTDLLTVARLAGIHALAAPVGKAAIAARLLRRSDTSAGFATIASETTGALVAGRFTGRLGGIAFGRHAATVVGQLGGVLFAIHTSDCDLVPAENPAGEPRDTFAAQDAAMTVLDEGDDLSEMGALLRIGQIGGSLDRCLVLSVEYANTRRQFGKPIGKFQAVQQSLAVMAEAVSATGFAGRAAAAALDAGDAWLEIGSAKLRANAAAATGAAIAHQIHGAIGFTQEYELQHLTRRLQSWRAEFGNDRHWAERLGRGISLRCQGDLWSLLTARGDAAPRQTC